MATTNSKEALCPICNMKIPDTAEALWGNILWTKKDQFDHMNSFFQLALLSLPSIWCFQIMVPLEYYDGTVKILLITVLADSSSHKGVLIGYTIAKQWRDHPA